MNRATQCSHGPSTFLEHALVQDMIEANRLFHVKKDSGHAMRIFSFHTERLASIGWEDVALQNRTDGGSTKVLLFTCSSEKALQGAEALLSVFSWRSSRIARVCRSAPRAETRATVDLEEVFALSVVGDDGSYSFWNSPDDTARLVLCACVTESKGSYDKMCNTEFALKGNERRVDIECLDLKEGLEASSARLFWCETWKKSEKDR